MKCQQCGIEVENKNICQNCESTHKRAVVERTIAQMEFENMFSRDIEKNIPPAGSPVWNDPEFTSKYIKATCLASFFSGASFGCTSSAAAFREQFAAFFKKDK